MYNMVIIAYYWEKPSLGHNVFTMFSCKVFNKIHLTFMEFFHIHFSKPSAAGLLYIRKAYPWLYQSMSEEINLAPFFFESSFSFSSSNTSGTLVVSWSGFLLLFWTNLGMIILLSTSDLPYLTWNKQNHSFIHNFSVQSSRGIVLILKSI